MKRILFILPLLIIFLAACAPSPKNIAQAHAIEVKADSDAATAAQELKQDQDAYGERMQFWQSIKQQVIAAAKTTVWVGVISLNGLILALAFALGIFTVETGRARAKAAYQLALNQANQIRLDEVTRTFPLIPRYVGGTCFSIMDPNSGANYLLDMARDADRQQISAMGATQLAGLLADALTKTKDPGGLLEAFAAWQIPVTQAVTPDLKVGTSIITVEER